MSTAKVALRSLSDPLLRDVSAGSQVDFMELRRRPTVLFISYNVEDIEYLKFYLSIFWTQLMTSFTKVPAHDSSILPIYCQMDEFQNLGRIPGMEQSIATLRKFRVSLFLFIQGLAGLHQYGKAAKIIEGNCKTKLFTGGLDYDDCKYVSNMLGKATIRYNSPNSSDLSREERLKDTREMSRSLLEAEEVRQLPPDQIIMFHGAAKPALLGLNPYYQDKELMKFVDLPLTGSVDYMTNRVPIKYVNIGP